MARATTSLPVPVSPVIRIVLLERATVSSSWNSARIGWLRPRMPAELIAFLELRPKVGVLRGEPALLERLLQDVHQLVELERLGR